MESLNRSIPLFISSSSMNWTYVEGNVNVPEEVSPVRGLPSHGVPPWGPAGARPPLSTPIFPPYSHAVPHRITPTPCVAPVAHQHPQHPTHLFFVGSTKSRHPHCNSGRDGNRRLPKFSWGSKCTLFGAMRGCLALLGTKQSPLPPTWG